MEDYIWDLERRKLEIAKWDIKLGWNQKTTLCGEKSRIKKSKNMAEKKLEDKRGDNGKAGYVDEDGNWVIEPKFDFTWSFEDGIAKVELKRKSGFIKTDGT